MPTKVSPYIRAVAIAALMSGLAFASPSFAATSGSSSGMSMDSSGMGGGKGNMAQAVETRIQNLHAKLQITPEQESEWNDVAQAMRDNEASIHQAIQSRHQNATTMTAVDDLQSYQKIAQTHADGLEKVISSFSTLYNDMSPAQQKNADQVFGQWEGHRGVAKASASKKGSMSGSGGTGGDSSENMDSE